MDYNFDKILVREGTHSYKWDHRKEVFGTEDVLPLWVADMDFECAKPIVETLKSRANHKNYGYTARPATFYDAIIEWLEGQHGWTVGQKEINVTPGVIPALNLAIREFSNPGDKVIVQPPVYYPFYDVVQKNGRRILLNQLELQEGNYRMDFENLELLLDDPRAKILILCSPHNPVGRVWTKKELKRLGNLCLQHNVLVIADEIHSDLIFEGYTHTPFASISEEFAQQSITCNSPSKTFNLSGLTTAYTIIPNHVNAKRFESMIQNIGLTLTNLFGIEALIAAYKEGEEWYSQLMEYLGENRKFLCEFIHENIPKINPIAPEGTYLVWLDCRELGLESEDLKKFMVENARVGLTDGTKFSPGGDGFQRINIGCSRDILRKALRRIEKAVNLL